MATVRRRGQESLNNSSTESGDNVQINVISSSTDVSYFRHPTQRLPITSNRIPNVRVSRNPYPDLFPIRQEQPLPNPQRFDNIGLLEHSIPQGCSTKQAVLTVTIAFLTYFTALAWIYMSFPELDESEKSSIKIPYDIEDAKNLGRVLDRYKEKYYIEVLALVFTTYIFLNTFAIPGSISLSILSGFLFPFPLALFLVSFCTATGASMCYLLSSVLGRRLVHKYIPERAAQWAVMVNKHRDNIFNYILFLRMTPFLPNWFINIASPCIDVPLFPFWMGTFVGVMPPSFLAIQAGKTLHQMSADKTGWSWSSVGLLGFFATLSLLPVLYKNRLRRKFE